MTRLKKLQNLLFPPRCIYCRKSKGDVEYGLCKECLSKIPLRLHKAGMTWYLFEYDNRISEALKRAKYSNRPQAAGDLAGLMGEMLKGKVNPDIVTYVPMTKKDLGERGYNQGCMIAREICKKVGGRLCGKALLKKRGNKKQALLDKRQRKNNVRDVFEARIETVKGREVLLVDDIMTTGSTIEECRDALIRAGAEKVEAAVLAYTPLR